MKTNKRVSKLGRGLESMFAQTDGNRKGTKHEQDEEAQTIIEEKIDRGETNNIDQSNKAKSIENKKDERSNKFSEEILVKTSLVSPNPSQPRKKFDEEALQELTASIKVHGVIQPLLVTKKGNYYEIIAGERRWRAAREAGLKEIPVLVREYTPQEIAEISLIENIQREDLNPIEEANAYKKLLEEYHLKQNEVAERVSKSRTAITNSMRLLKLDKRVQQALVDSVISAGHARAILAIENQESQYEALKHIIKKSLNVRDTEKYVQNIKEGKTKDKELSKEDDDSRNTYKAIEEKLMVLLSTKATIKCGKRGNGTIELQYYSHDDLERIIDIIKRGAKGE